jgi:hypothetical protein
VPKIIFKSIDRWRIDNVTRSPDFNDFTSFWWISSLFWSLDNRDFLVKYLNKLWKEDHPS